MRRQESGVAAVANEEARGKEAPAEDLAAMKMAKVRRPLKRTSTRGHRKVDDEFN